MRGEQTRTRLANTGAFDPTRPNMRHGGLARRSIARPRRRSERTLRRSQTIARLMMVMPAGTMCMTVLNFFRIRGANIDDFHVEVERFTG